MGKKFGINQILGESGKPNEPNCQFSISMDFGEGDLIESASLFLEFAAISEEVINNLEENYREHFSKLYDQGFAVWSKVTRRRVDKTDIYILRIEVPVQKKSEFQAVR